MATRGPAAGVVCLGFFALQSLICCCWCAGGPPGGGGFVGSRLQTQRSIVAPYGVLCMYVTGQPHGHGNPSSPAAAHLSKSRKVPAGSAEPSFQRRRMLPVPGRSQARGGLDLADSCSWLSAPWRHPISGDALARLSCHETLFLPNDDPGILASATTASPISHAPAGGSWPSGPRRLCSVVRLVSPPETGPRQTIWAVSVLRQHRMDVLLPQTSSVGSVPPTPDKGDGENSLYRSAAVELGCGLDPREIRIRG